MAKRTQTYRFEELDKNSRGYLLVARDRQGRGMPGLYIPTPNHLPIVGFILGIVVLVVMWIIAWNQIEQEPLGVAMLQTVGLLLGGWMIVAAIRVWIAATGKNYAGHFIYADAETLWECQGGSLTATDLYGIVDSEGQHNYTNEGKYQNTSVTVYLKKGKRRLTLVNQRHAEQLTIFLNTLAWLRKGGDSAKLGPDAEDPSKLPAAILGGIARENAIEENIPRKWTASALDIDVEDVPIPQRKGRAANGLIALAVIVALGAISVFALSRLNIGWRDDAIWDNINDIRYQDARAPWLRAYLADARNTRHRDEARTMLRDIYAQTVTRIRRSSNVNGPQFPNVNPQPNAGGPRIDSEFLDGLEVVLKELADLPLPDVSISVKDKTGGPQAKAREEQFLKKYAQVIFEGVGGDPQHNHLIRVAQAPDGVIGMIHVEWEFVTANNVKRAYFTFTFRKAPDGEAVKTVQASEVVIDDSPARFEALANGFGLATAGPKKPPPPQPE